MDTLLKGVVGLFAIFVVALLVRGITSDAPIDSLMAIFDNPFATAFTIEMVLGILVLAIIVFLIESDTTTAIIWIALIFSFGNPAAAAYLIVRYNYLKSLTSSE